MSKKQSKRVIPDIKNPYAAKVLDFNEQDWWGEDYSKFSAEIKQMKQAGWEVHSQEPEKRPTRVVLYPPKREEDRS